jgi:DUF2075 family protein/thymidine kinase
MIVYAATKLEFTHDVMTNRIEEKIIAEFEKRFGKANDAEIRSWRNSMVYMNNILLHGQIPDDSSVAVEYQVPNTSKRVDFIISGLDEQLEESVVIVELKQWESAKKTNKDGIVVSYVGGAERELVHPSHQAFTYARLIQEFNEVVQRDNIHIYPCSYLHNFKRSEFQNPILDEWYREYLDLAPAFLREDTDELIDFIQRYIHHGDRNNILYRIDHGRIRPSKALADTVSSMLKGNKEFYMIDDQKVVYESIMDIVLNNPHQEKRTVIVEGGPGTGKSVVAINLLVQMLNHTKNAQYITRNAAPREVYKALLKQDFKRNFIDNLFRGTGSFTDTSDNYFDVLICDEAHRLNEKSGMFQNKGEHQIKEIIHSSVVSIFFIDENQIVTLKDIGSVEEIRRQADDLGSQVYQMELSSQFRCNGSDGYLAWLDHILEIRETANTMLDPTDFDFQVFDNPNDLRDVIFEKNKINNKARLLAGYCWDWEKDKRNDTNHHDIVIEEFDFGMSWNLGTDGQAYLIQPESVNQVGCIHTSQGLELDYVGVIIGDDLRFENGNVITDVTKRSSYDQSVKGWKTALKKRDGAITKKIDDIIRNTYRTLLSRGMKGCYVYCTDKPLMSHIQRGLKNHVK